MQFAYDLRCPPFPEQWASGACLFHNPRALYPIPDGFIDDAFEVKFTDRFWGRIPIHHIYHSRIGTSNVGAQEFPVGEPSAVLTVPPSDVTAMNLNLMQPPNTAALGHKLQNVNCARMGHSKGWGLKIAPVGCENR